VTKMWKRKTFLHPRAI